MNIYTKTGDDGETGLFGGPRVRKDAARIEAYGTVDELNSLLGVVRAEPLSRDMDAVLARLQNELFNLGAELATPNAARLGESGMRDEHVAWLEQTIDRHEQTLQPLKAFILPGGTRAAALLHLGRTVCRRAERRVITLSAEEEIRPLAVVYLNRLSDLLFVLARAVNAGVGVPDVPWAKESHNEGVALG